MTINLQITKKPQNSTREKVKNKTATQNKIDETIQQKSHYQRANRRQTIVSDTKYQ